ncbi:serine/threonine-protein kinase [Sorangium sp. So ce429]
MQLDSGVIIAGKYRLEHPLSAGGMGSVWVAQHVQLGTQVAVKFMGTAYASAPAFRARFEREARAAAHLRSPHVVQVHDFGFELGVPYLVMELLRGEDLSKRLARVRRLSLPETQRLLVQAGKALRSVHDAGLVHRDLKPANLFLARVDGEDEDLLKLIDFGIAKETGPKLVTEASTTGEVMGSPHYMSPEQLRADRDIDARSDLWAMGVILFRMVTGYLPFPGEVLAQVMTRILVEPIPSARQLAADLPPALDAFFARALARDRAHRFQTVREMVEEFGRATGTTAVFSSSGTGGASPFGWTATGAPGTAGLGGATAGGPAGAAGVMGGATPGGHGRASYTAAPAQVPGGEGGNAAVGQEPLPGTLTDAVHTDAVHAAGPSRQRSRGARAALIIAGGVGIAAVGLGLGLGVVLRRALEVPGGPGGETAGASAAAETTTGAAAGASAAAETTTGAAAADAGGPGMTKAEAPAVGGGAPVDGGEPMIAPAPGPEPAPAPGASGVDAGASAAPDERAQVAQTASSATSAAPGPAREAPGAPTREVVPRAPRPEAGGQKPASSVPPQGSTKGTRRDWGF